MWKWHIQIAQNAGIDGFVLNTAPSLDPAGGISGAIGTQLANAFQAAGELGSSFKLFIAFDYLGAGKPWQQTDVISVLQLYANDPSYFRYGGRAYVSTFEGTGNIGDWAAIKSAVSGGIFFVPDWTSLGPAGITAQLGLIDGAFSWDMWPSGPEDITDASDLAWKAALAGKHFMMGVSPWFYTNLPGYSKTWVWRGDDMWHTRWDQVANVQPDMVQIVTWNDYGESHYIGPIVASGIPQDAAGNADARPYVNGMPHDHWRDLLPYYIASFKSGGTVPAVTNEKLQYWYRLTPAAAGSSGSVTGGNGPTFPPAEVVQDNIFFTALVNAPATVSVQIGSNAPTQFQATSAGINHFSQPFNGQTGNVTLSIQRNGQLVLMGTGEAIQAQPSGGSSNFNAWVGGAST
jgi:glucan endo-1,3-alpha-glucosidase